jgi:hypothetical protein
MIFALFSLFFRRKFRSMFWEAANRPKIMKLTKNRKMTDDFSSCRRYARGPVEGRGKLKLSP